MGKQLVIIIADTEETVVDTIELKFLQEMKDNVKLEVITDPEYFKTFFSTPRTADVLAVGEDLYDESLLRHDIKHRIRILSRNSDCAEEETERIKPVYKYSTSQEIYSALTVPWKHEGSMKQKSKLVMVYSPIGGAGKTTIAVGISSALSPMGRVLYINAESMNTFGVFLEKENQENSLPGAAYESMNVSNKNLYSDMKQFFATNGARGNSFSYLPPASNSVASSGGDVAALYKLGLEARASGDFDYIIVDVDSAYTHDKGMLMTNADKVLLIYEQDKISAYKMDKLQRNISCSDTEKYIFVCNKFESAKMNYFLTKKYISTAEIETDKDIPLSSAVQIGKSEGIKKLALSLTLN